MECIIPVLERMEHRRIARRHRTHMIVREWEGKNRGGGEDRGERRACPAEPVDGKLRRKEKKAGGDDVVDQKKSGSARDAPGVRRLDRALCEQKKRPRRDERPMERQRAG